MIETRSARPRTCFSAADEQHMQVNNRSAWRVALLSFEQGPFSCGFAASLTMTDKDMKRAQIGVGELLYTTTRRTHRMDGGGKKM